MQHHDENPPPRRKLQWRLPQFRHYAWWMVALWTVCVAASASWSIYREFQSARDMALSQARAHYNEDLAFRTWAAARGGIYVPVNERNIPSPYLAHIPDRDITLPSGKHLTLVNTARIIRQIQEETTKPGDVVTHITSLKLLRPENAPDDWERAALLAFNEGEPQRQEFMQRDGEQ